MSALPRAGAHRRSPGLGEAGVALFAVFLALSLGLFAFGGLRAGFYDERTGLLLFAVGSGGILAFAGWRALLAIRRNAAPVVGAFDTHHEERHASALPPAAVVTTLPDDIISSWSDTAAALFGYTSREVIGRSSMILVPPGATGEEVALMERIRRGERIVGFETVRRHKDGSLLDVSLSASPARDASNAVVGVSMSITRIHEGTDGEQRFRELLESAPDAMVIIDAQGRILLANAQTESMFGMPRSVLTNRPLDELVPARLREDLVRHRADWLADPDVRLRRGYLEIAGVRANGDEFPLELSLSPLKTERGVRLIAALRDVTASKRAEEKFRGLLEASADAIVILDAKGSIVLANRHAEALFRQRRGGLLGKDFVRLFPERLRAAQHAELRAFLARPRAKPMGRGAELSAVRSDGTEFPAEVSVSPLESEGADLACVAIRDITSQKVILAALREKETLLREIHHRVKNNLQVTSGLLLLQSRNAKDEATRELFTESMSRVKSMALVHEKLYESRDLANIDFPEYVKDLLRELQVSHGALQRHVTIKSDILPVAVDLDTCVNLGLILNELVSNSIKHAFPAGREGHIRVTLVPEDDHKMSLRVSDDGIGLPPEIDVANTRTMGLQLVSGLARQVNGTMSVHRGQGTEIRVTLPAPRPRAPPEEDPHDE